MSVLSEGVIVMAKKALKPMPNALASPGMKAGDFIFVTGQVGAVDDNGKPIAGVEAQTRQTLENMKKVLKAGGATMDDVVKTTVFLVKAEDFAVMNKAYVEYFNQADKPARSTVIVAALAKPEWIVEIECIAYRP